MFEAKIEFSINSQFLTAYKTYGRMVRIQNETTYKAAMERIEELLPLTDDNVPLTDKNLIELDLLSKLVSEYEDEHYPIKTPSLVNVMKLRMYEMGIN